MTADDSWDGLAIVVTFNPPEGDAVEVRVPEDGTVDVPPEATTYEGKGTIVFCGVDSGVQRITKTMGYVVITHANVGTDTAFTPSEDLAAQVLNAALSAERSSTEAQKQTRRHRAHRRQQKMQQARHRQVPNPLTRQRRKRQRPNLTPKVQKQVQKRQGIRKIRRSNPERKQPLRKMPHKMHRLVQKAPQRLRQSQQKKRLPVR